MEKIPPSIRLYLDEIAQCLWSKNASIMIGAGFSMNAKPSFEGAKRFPTWQDLGTLFYNKVRGAEIKEAKYNFFDPLKLAYEVESNFGRAVLDSILRNSIPDLDYKPSELHRDLLSLPWTDVFTTNYDTLLERAADFVTERNYKVVVNKDNLVHSIPPRIVKLHGCFAASTPLIISEEDYRTYPSKFAPFVNTVQQTLLENTLCLIGFSGDDPNFLKWIGWIRDNLGAQNAPKIYLLGVLNLSNSQEKALGQYNITCVDLALCDGIAKNDHGGGIATFIEYCQFRKDDAGQKRWHLSGTLINSPINSISTSDINLVNTELTELTTLWKGERLNYPNWLIAPSDLRKKLWVYTSNWSSVFDNFTRERISILKDFTYEFLWRKEKSLIPIFDGEVELIVTVLIADFTDDNVADNKTFYIALALLRYYREEGKKNDWLALYSSVNKHINGQIGIDYLTYEKALYLLIENKSVELTELLSKWSDSGLSAIWMYRKASILAEGNKLTDAQDILEKSLIKTRRNINATESITDYADVSLESYILVLLNYVNMTISIQAGQWEATSKQEYLERLSELKRFECNPQQEMQLLELEIKHQPSPLRPISVTSGFDIGSQNTTHHLSPENTEVLNAFRFLRFFEDAAIPFALPRVQIAVTGANNAIKRIANVAAFWSMSTMLRTRDTKSSELIFTRESLSDIHSSFIDGLAERYIELLNSYANEENSWYEYGLVLPEALSLLCCKVTLPIKDKILTLLVRIYSSKPTKHAYQSIDKLVKRLIYSYRDSEIIQRIERVTDISFKVIENNGKEVDRYTFPNPFKYFLNLSSPGIKNTKSDLILSTEKIKVFLNALESENIEVRQNSSITLIILQKLGFLNNQQERSLLSKLLVYTDEYGLPENTGYHKFAYVEIFNENNDIKNAFRKYLLETSPLIQVNVNTPQSFTLSGQPDPFTIELLGGFRLIDWNKKELHHFANKLIKWWQADKLIFEQRGHSDRVVNEMNSRFSRFIDSIDAFIIKNKLTEYKETVAKIVSDFQVIGLDHLRFKACAIGYIAYNPEKLIVEIEEALATFEQKQVLDAIFAINTLLCKTKSRNRRALDVIATFIRYSRGSYLANAFQVVINVLKAKGVNFNNLLENSVLTALGHVTNGFKQLSFEENLYLKKEAARLAYELSIYYSEREQTLPDIIDRWKKICDSKDEFAEIKKEWKK
jgi:hypothetical protein